MLFILAGCVDMQVDYMRNMCLNIWNCLMYRVNLLVRWRIN